MELPPDETFDGTFHGIFDEAFDETFDRTWRSNGSIPADSWRAPMYRQVFGYVHSHAYRHT